MDLQANEPCIVRRKGKALPTELLPGGSISHQIDWKRSVLLNMVTQTSYSMTVSACPRDQLHSIGSGQQLAHGVIEVCCCSVGLGQPAEATPSGGAKRDQQAPCPAA